MISQFSFILFNAIAPSPLKDIQNTYHRQKMPTSKSFRWDHPRQSFGSSLMMPLRKMETNEMKREMFDDFQFSLAERFEGKKVKHQRDSPLQSH